MIFSEQLLFSDAQAITASAKSTNVIDMSAVSPLITSRFDMGIGVVIPILIQVVTGFTTSANTLTVSIETDDNEGFASAKTVLGAPAKPASEMTSAGFIFPINYMPRGVNERYMRLDYTVSAALAAGKVTAGIILGMPQGNL